MRLRPWILGALIVVGIGVNVYLMVGEPIAAGEREAGHRALREDPLLDLPYTASSRQSDFTRLGLDGVLLSQAVERIKQQDQANRALLEDRIQNVGDPDQFMKAFCRTGLGDLPPHYAGLRWLVADEGGTRTVLSVPRTTSLEPWDWATVSPISEVYATVELTDDRRPDATVMGLSAILLGREVDLLERRTPWGQGLAGRWSWERVQKENPGVGERVVEYLTLLHLTMEIVTAEGGFCRD